MMKRMLAAAALAALALPTQAADVGVSISIGQPGFYGQIDIGDFPRPVLIDPRPVVIERVTVHRDPIYLRVPPGHAKNWRRYCNRYDACGRPVYFVQDRWYQDVYAPRYRERHHAKHRQDRRDDRRDWRDERRDDRHDRRDDRRDDRHDRRDDRRDDHGRGR
jgi:hypothetical protein